MIDFLRRCIKRQFSRSHLWYWAKLYLSYLGTYYVVLKILLLIRDAYFENENWSEFCEVIDRISGVWVVWELLIILVLAIFTGWKRIRTVYSLGGGQKIVFDYCSLLKQNGDIVVEVPNSFTTNQKYIEQDSTYSTFLKHYREINKSEALFDIIKKDLKSKLFKPETPNNAHKEKERYELGTFCKISFDGKNYLLAASFKTDVSYNITSGIEDYNVFLCQLWANLSRFESDRKVLEIPIFGIKGHPYGDKLTTEKKVYQILKTYIFNAKKNASCAKELHICFYDDKENELDLDKFVTLAKYIDEFRTEEYEDKKPQGTALG